MDQIIFAGPESDRELFDFIIKMSQRGCSLFEPIADFYRGELQTSTPRRVIVGREC